MHFVYRKNVTEVRVIKEEKTMNRVKRKNTDRRSCYTMQAIKDAFLEKERKKIFNEISVAEICREAEISRSTFYQYYDNVTDVLEDVLGDIGLQCSNPFIIHRLLNTGELSCCGKDRLCEFVRREKKYQGIFLDESLSSKIINALIPDFHCEDPGSLRGEIDATDEELKVYYCFQLNGCLSVVRKTLGQSEEAWEKTRQALDRIVENSLTTFKTGT